MGSTVDSPMDDRIKKAIQAVDENLAAIKKNDYAHFLAGYTPRIQAMLTPEMFAKAVAMMKEKPLTTKIIKAEASELMGPNAVKLKMTNGRTLCTVGFDGKAWVIDNIYWK